MASTSETGYAKTVASFEDLISFCTGYGPAYKPTKATLQLPSMGAVLTNAQAALQNVKAAKTAHDNATNAREIAFKAIRPLSTKVISALAATGVPSQTLDDAKSMNFKIQGRRVRALKSAPAQADVAVAEAPKTASASQQSFDKIIDHFAQLVQTLAAETSYAPNENELRVETLTIIIADLRSKNSAVIGAATAWSNARIARDKVLYGEDTGLCDVALDAKLYVKSVFGPSSPQYLQIRKLSFPKRKI